MSDIDKHEIILTPQEILTRVLDAYQHFATQSQLGGLEVSMRKELEGLGFRLKESIEKMESLISANHNNLTKEHQFSVNSIKADLTEVKRELSRQCGRIEDKLDKHIERSQDQFDKLSAQLSDDIRTHTESLKNDLGKKLEEMKAEQNERMKKLESRNDRVSWLMVSLLLTIFVTFIVHEVVFPVLKLH